MTAGKKLMNLVLLGAPGGGKGTIAKKIVKDFNFKHISTGDLLRKNIVNKTDVGLAAEAYMNEGKLVPDSIVVKLLKNEINEISQTAPNSNFLLDGFPRTISQAEELNRNINVNMVMSLVIPYPVIIERLSNRWIHLPSGRTYAYDYNPPKKVGFDDVTNEPLVQRDDDEAEVVAARLESYSKMSLPIVSFYKSLQAKAPATQGPTSLQVKEFHGTESNVIYVDVKKTLEEYFSK